MDKPPPDGIPNPITVLVATLVTRPHEIRPMIGNGLRQIASMGLTAIARQVASGQSPVAKPETEPESTTERKE